MSKFYITTTLPYVNANPHIGFALEIVQADTIARTHRLLGDEVIFNFGTDEHGLKIYKKALEEGKNPQDYVDEYAKKFDALKEALNLTYTNFIRTTNPIHKKAAQEFWKRCLENKDIYKKMYKVKYCVGCELEKTESELVEGKCPLHPNLELEIIEEENYFFRFSKYQKPLLNFYKENPNFIVPNSKFKEIKSFVKKGLQDFSISRLKAKMPWGIDIPNDPEQVMYVWFDALINYISTLGWPKQDSNYKNFWPGYQFAGKDNLRQQAAIWQAMLMSAGLPNSRQIFIHGFITVNGQKISKSLGNAINPIEIVNKYGTDALRYYLLAKIHPYEDSDFTYEKFEKVYNADLANGLGNLFARISAMTRNLQIETDKKKLKISKEVVNWLSEYRFDKALKFVWQQIKKADIYINENKVWELPNIKKKNALSYLINAIEQIAFDLQPFLPETAEKILNYDFTLIKAPQKPLFPRLKQNK
ncbi:MAG: methionine--tRNA ligase [Patescibacteria group bacterium]|nr:methionine--tRNA ligase [Patescibacteria group bacterium]